MIYLDIGLITRCQGSEVSSNASTGNLKFRRQNAPTLGSPITSSTNLTQPHRYSAQIIKDIILIGNIRESYFTVVL